MIQNNDPEHCNQQNIEELISRKELRITFGRNAVAEKIDNDDKKWKVVGKFQDGITEGGQNFACELMKINIQDGENKYECWQMTKVSINNQEFPDLLQTQTLVFPPEQDEDLDDELSYSNYSSRIQSGYIPNDDRIILTSLSRFDNFIGLIHENMHKKSFKNIPENDYSDISKYIALRNKIQEIYSFSDLDLSQSIADVISSTSQNELFIAKHGCELNLQEEIKVNLPTKGWFKTDVDLIRVQKFLTTNTLQYSRNLEQIFGNIK